MNKIMLTCRACGDAIVLETALPSQELTVLAVHTECALVYAKAA